MAEHPILPGWHLCPNCRAQVEMYIGLDGACPKCFLPFHWHEEREVKNGKLIDSFVMNWAKFDKPNKRPFNL